MEKDVLKLAVATNPKMNRRKYLALAGGAVVVAAAAAGGYYLTLPKQPKLAASVRYDAPGGSIGDALTKLTPAFEQEYGVKVQISPVEQVAGTMLEKIKAGGAGFDLIELGDDGMYAGAAQGAWEELRMENIPNQKKLPELFQTNGHGAFDPGIKDGIWHGTCGPVYGTTAIGYNYGKITDDVNSYAAMWDERYKGKIITYDYYSNRMNETAAYLGQKFNNFTDLNAIWDALAKQQKLVLKNWSSGAELEQLFGSEEAWIGDAWASRIMTAAKGGVPCKYIIPKEGVVAWAECLMIAKGSQHRYESELLINWILDPKNLVAISKAWNYPAVVDTSLISQEDLAFLKTLPDFVGTQYSLLTFNDAKLFVDNGQEWSTKWEEVKAG